MAALVTGWRGKVRVSALVVVALAAVGSMGVAPARSSAPRPAPRLGWLPIADDARVIASAAAGSDVDTAYDRKRYRYLAIAAERGERTTRLLAREVEPTAAHRLAARVRVSVRMDPQAQRRAVPSRFAAGGGRRAF